MQMNRQFYWQHFLSNFLAKKKNKIHSKRATTPDKNTLQIFRAIAFTGFSVMILLSPITNAMGITADMNPEVVAEYKIQLAAQTWPEMHTKLAFMDNPYKKFDRAIRKKLKAEAEPGQRKRLRTHEESILAAKKQRFDHCQASVTFFVDFAKRTHTLTTVEQKPLSKETLMTDHGVAYPFTEEETNNGKTRPTQLALTLGWKYKGKGQESAELFLATCLALPVSLYYKEEKAK